MSRENFLPYFGSIRPHSYAPLCSFCLRPSHSTFFSFPYYFNPFTIKCYHPTAPPSPLSAMLPLLCAAAATTTTHMTLEAQRQWQPQACRLGLQRASDRNGNDFNIKDSSSATTATVLVAAAATFLHRQHPPQLQPRPQCDRLHGLQRRPRPSP